MVYEAEDLKNRAQIDRPSRQCYNIVVTGVYSVIKTLQKHGNSHALVFDRSMMDAMNISEDSPLQVNISGNTLLVTPLSVGIGKEAVDASIRKLRPRYRQMLKNLAE